MTPSRSTHASHPDLIFYGGPASGKTTQVQRLAKKFSANPIFVGERLREIAKTKTALGQSVAKRIDNGKLVSHKLLIALIRKWISSTPQNQMIISDGAPRDLSETKMYDRILAAHGRYAVAIYLKLPVSIAKERILARAKKEKRLDDINAAAVAARIQLFASESQEILQYYKQRDRLIVVDANQPIAQLSKTILAKIQQWVSKHTK